MVATFDELYDSAAKLKGGRKALEALLPKLKSPAQLKKIPDDRWLSAMTKRIFQAGFSWRVIEDKWPGFEDAFEGFDVARWTLMSDDDVDRLARDRAIVRNPQKIRTVGANAVFLADLAREYGSAAKCFADWPNEDFVGLLELLKARASRMGGATGAFFLRGMGKDSFMLSGDVVKALVREGVIDKAPTSKKALAAVQAAFNAWCAESGRPLAHVSRVLAATVDSPPPERPQVGLR
jgi:3-methyladenine DNA glycosylase Tag